MPLTLNPNVAMMRPSQTMAVSARARELRRQGKPVIALSAGEPDFPTPERIAEAGIRAIRDGKTRYTDVAGTIDLREAVAAKLEKENGVTYETDQILCCNGAKQAVSQAIMALCGPGDEVVIPAPYWVSYPDMTLLAGGVPRVIRTTAEAEYRISADQLAEAINDETRIVILCSPSNPTGSVYPRAELEALADVLRSREEVWVISDEIYEHIVFDAEHVCFASLEGMYERTITVNGFSKAFAMTGWRLGYLAGARDFVSAARKIQGQTTSAPCTISQWAGVKALETGPEVIAPMVEAFRRRRDMVLSSLRSIPGVICPKPEGAFYLFPNISAYFDRTSPSGRHISNSEDLCLYLLEEHDVALVPGDAFGDPNGLRLSYALSEDDLKEALTRIRRGLGDLQ